jgi:hypothetical protein
MEDKYSWEGIKLGGSATHDHISKGTEAMRVILVSKERYLSPLQIYPQNLLR